MLTHPNLVVGDQSHLHHNICPGVNLQQITRGNISALSSNHLSNVLDLSSQETVPSLPYRKLFSGRHRTQYRFKTGGIRENLEDLDLLPIDSARFADRQSSQISGVRSKIRLKEK